MRSVLLAALALAAILVALRIHVADVSYRAGRDLDPDDPRRVTLLERAALVDPGDALYAFRLGVTALEGGTAEDLDRAIAWLDRAARRNPVMARTQYWWGVALERLGREEEAVARFETARRLAPYNVDLNGRIAEFYARRWGRSRAAEDLRRAFEAYHALRLVEPRALSEGLQAILRQPVLRYEELDAVVPRTVEARTTLAETLAAARRFRWAVRAFDEADERAGANGALAARGRLLWYEDLRTDHPEAAAEAIAEARRLAGSEFDRELDLADALLRVGRDAEARVALRRHLRRAPSLGPAIAGIHAVFARRPRGDAARVELAFWTEVGPEYPGIEASEIDLHRAEAAYASGNPGAALVSLGPYMRREPDSVAAFVLAARCYHDLGRDDLARSHLQQALDRQPTLPEDVLELAAALGLEGVR